MRSIRRNLVFALSMGTAGLAAVAGLTSGRAIESRLRRTFDEALETKAQALAALTEQRAGIVKVEFADESMPEFSIRAPLEYFEIWTATGELVESSRSLGGRHLPRQAGRRDEPVFRDAILPDGRRGRSVSIAFVPELEDDDDPWADGAVAARPDPPGERRRAEVTVARGTEELERLVRSIYAADLAVAGGLALALALFVGWVVRRGFAPLDAVAQAVGGLDERRLDRRIELDPPVRELDPIVRRLNLLLARLEGAFERERRFSADVAHELRTPVTELRTLSEVGERWSGDTDLARELFRDAARVADRMERSVEQMLALARADAGGDAVEREAVDLQALVGECLEACAGASASAGASVVRRLAPTLVVITDRAKLALALRNLVDNAIAYTPPGETIEIATRSLGGGGFALEVTNSAPQLAAADLPHLFERFWRKDAARADPRHSGLGLSLVQSLCERLGLRVGADLDERDRRLTVTISGSGAAPAADPAV